MSWIGKLVAKNKYVGKAAAAVKALTTFKSSETSALVAAAVVKLLEFIPAAAPVLDTVCSVLTKFGHLTEVLPQDATMTPAILFAGLCSYVGVRLSVKFKRAKVAVPAGPATVEKLP